MFLSCAHIPYTWGSFTTGYVKRDAATVTWVRADRLSVQAKHVGGSGAVSECALRAVKFTSERTWEVLRTCGRRHQLLKTRKTPIKRSVNSPDRVSAFCHCRFELSSLASSPLCLLLCCYTLFIWDVFILMFSLLYGNDGAHYWSL